jgi:carbonic anhydrase/acetyltransferase-like protein (isoleucine patch superfamily)
MSSWLRTLRNIAVDCKSVVDCIPADLQVRDQRMHTMARMPEPLIVSIRGRAPEMHAESWVAPNASLIGQVNLAARASIWYGATLRAEAEPIDIGFGSNIQDGVTIHVDPEFPVSVGAGVSVGHNVVLHGCVVEDDALIGMGAVILNGAHIGKGSLIAASALVPQGVVIPPRSLVTGVPGKVRRELSDAEVASNRFNAEYYQRLIDLHREALD